jgi:MOSC domain-containing protein YiiM
MHDIPDTGEFAIVSLNVSARTGTRKQPVERVRLVEGYGVEGDAHGGLIEDRQVSLLAMEELEKASASLSLSKCVKAGGIDKLSPGDFAENITTRGLALHLLPIGTRLALGDTVLEVSKIGKECHAACEIRTLIGDCVMPRRGIFARVLRGGEVNRADSCHYGI